MCIRDRYYNEYGVLQLMAVLPKTTAGAAHSFVYGLATSRRIPAEYTICLLYTSLFRSEFLFMDRTDLPSEEEQFAAYKKACEIMQGKPVIIRTLDIGGDLSLIHI